MKSIRTLKKNLYYMPFNLLKHFKVNFSILCNSFHQYNILQNVSPEFATHLVISNRKAQSNFPCVSHSQQMYDKEFLLHMTHLVWLSLSGMRVHLSKPDTLRDFHFCAGGDSRYEHSAWLMSGVDGGNPILWRGMRTVVISFC